MSIKLEKPEPTNHRHLELVYRHTLGGCSLLIYRWLCGKIFCAMRSIVKAFTTNCKWAIDQNGYERNRGVITKLRYFAVFTTKIVYNVLKATQKFPRALFAQILHRKCSKFSTWFCGISDRNTSLWCESCHIGDPFFIIIFAEI